MGTWTVTTPSGNDWSVTSFSLREAAPASDEIAPWDEALAGAPPLEAVAVAGALSSAAVRRLRQGLSRTPRWVVRATDLKSGVEWVWLARNRRAAREVCDALSLGKVPEDISLSSGLGPHRG